MMKISATDGTRSSSQSHKVCIEDAYKEQVQAGAGMRKGCAHMVDFMDEVSLFQKHRMCK